METYIRLMYGNMKISLLYIAVWSFTPGQVLCLYFTYFTVCKCRHKLSLCQLSHDMRGDR